MPVAVKKKPSAATVSPVIYQKAITGLKRQREADTLKEVQKFLKTVLG